MNFKTWTPLALAIVLGLIAAKVARDTIARGRGGGERRSISVVVAKAPVAPGQELTADSLTMGPISAQVPPPGTFTDPSALVGRDLDVAIQEHVRQRYGVDPRELSQIAMVMNQLSDALRARLEAENPTSMPASTQSTTQSTLSATSQPSTEPVH